MVHKCGSTTVYNILARYALHHNLNVALPRRKYKDTEGWHTFGSFTEDRVMPLAPGQEFHLLFNHMTYNRTALDKVMPPGTFYCAIVREPVKRFISSVYYYNFLEPPRPDVSVSDFVMRGFLSEKNRAVLESKEHPFWVYNTIALDTGMALSKVKDEQAVEEHIAKLDREMDLVMVVEHFYESIVLLKRRAKLHLRDVIFIVENVRKQTATHRLADSDVTVLKAWQMADFKIYDHFHRKFREEVKKEGASFTEEVEHFKTVQKKQPTELEPMHYANN
nr:hypothetical protein BaRGS_009660 [Batillaria attramentaria]